MISYFKKHLHACQYLLFMAVITTALILIFGYFSEKHQEEDQNISLDMTIKEAAHLYSMSPRDLASELGLKEPISKRRPMKELGISQKDLSDLEHHLSSHNETNNVFLIYIIATLWGAFYLLYLEKSTLNKGNVQRYKRSIYIAALLFVVAFGFIYGKTPNPMQSVSRLLKACAGIYPIITDKLLVFAFFIILSTILNKIVCGWACPLGALQELIYSLPILKNIKTRKVPFIINNTIRIILLVLMLVFLFGGIVVKRGRSLYHGVNVFNLFDLKFDEPVIVATIILTLLLSMFLYRPFCNYICPFGLISWFVERLSIFRITIDKEKCINCGKCESICPTNAASDYLGYKKMPADCFSCARCLDICPTNAIKYKFGFSMNKRL